MSWLQQQQPLQLLVILDVRVSKASAVVLLYDIVLWKS